MLLCPNLCRSCREKYFCQNIFLKNGFSSPISPPLFSRNRRPPKLISEQKINFCEYSIKRKKEKRRCNGRKGTKLAAVDDNGAKTFPRITISDHKRLNMMTGGANFLTILSRLCVYFVLNVGQFRPLLVFQAIF